MGGLSLLLLLLLAPPTATATATATAPMAARALLRLPLENFDQMQFFGAVGVGTPPQRFDVIFDTGSSDVWLPAASCGACAGKRRYEPSASSSHEALAEAFQLEYGSGNASGSTMRETLALGRLSLASVRMGRATRTSPHLQRFRAEGIVGLGLEALSLVTTPSLFAAAATLRRTPGATATATAAADNESDADSDNNDDAGADLSALLARFSVYVNPLPGLEPPSQLIFGGADSSLVWRSGDNADSADAVQWHHFPVIPFPDQRSHGFWSLRLLELAVLDGAPPRIRSQRSAPEPASHRLASNAVAIVDSGTSVLLLPTRVFERALARIQRHLARRHGGLQLRASAFAVSGFACTQCAPEMFPPLAFTFRDGTAAGVHTLVLQGLDYVRCDGDACAPQLDAHVLFPADSEDVVVLGALFLRAYYALFDVQARRVGFACGDRGACRGGRNPKLQFSGGPAAVADGRLRASLVFWTRVYLGAGVLLLALAGALLWTMVRLRRECAPVLSAERLFSAALEQPRDILEAPNCLVQRIHYSRHAHESD
ncbi:hypothetical protein PybrP1_007667 [[Pythium] brassicae (nom. inval.)]|nr:hypothetical protein PybrP1_007667 [[Pythium] brassicae (nom. inval.)]